MKKKLAVAAMLIASILGFLFAVSGFGKRTDVLLCGYSVSEDGTTITLRTGLAGSMGYIRDIAVKEDENKVYASFYTAFGGLNSSIGAKNEFDITVSPTCTEIYFDRGEAGYVPVLYRDDQTNEWILR